MKPILVYPGSKAAFYPKLREIIPKDVEVLCEPFIGGGTTTLNLLEDIEFNIEKVVIGDKSPRVVAFWNSIVNDAEGLSKRYDELYKPFDQIINQLGTRREAFLEMEWFGQLPKDTIESKTERYKKIQRVRKEMYALHEELVKLDSRDELTQGARLALMHNISYSGVAFLGGLSYQRVIKTHIGGKLEGYRRASRLLKRAKAEVYCGDFSETCDKVLNQDGVFIYYDPPYYLQADKLYEEGVFDHKVLAEYIEKLPKNVRFLLSYDDSAYIRSLYQKKQGITMTEYKLPRGYVLGAAGKEVSLNGEELFISNYDVN